MKTTHSVKCSWISMKEQYDRMYKRFYYMRSIEYMYLVVI